MHQLNRLKKVEVQKQISKYIHLKDQIVDRLV